jgi:hypothetical protein
VLGRHDDAFGFTIGQRKGLRVDRLPGTAGANRVRRPAGAHGEPMFRTK